MTRVEVEEGAADRRSDEYAEASDTEAHSKASADLVQIAREGEDSARGKRNERA